MRRTARKVILCMDRPFRLSELFAQSDLKKIDRALVLDVLDELIEAGLVGCADYIDDLQCRYISYYRAC